MDFGGGIYSIFIIFNIITPLVQLCFFGLGIYFIIKTVKFYKEKIRSDQQLADKLDILIKQSQSKADVGNDTI